MPVRSCADLSRTVTADMLPLTAMRFAVASAIADRRNLRCGPVAAEPVELARKAE